MPAAPTTRKELANSLGIDMSGLSVQVQSGSTLYSGSGAPANGLGSLGDFYLRTDTPGTANQRIYVKTGAATWTGVV